MHSVMRHLMWQEQRYGKSALSKSLTGMTPNPLRRHQEIHGNSRFYSGTGKQHVAKQKYWRRMAVRRCKWRPLRWLRPAAD
jgi:hypothetical protein